MKNIKFRVWDEKNKKMIYSDDFNMFYEFFEQACLDEDKAMQFTGFQDIHGKDIFEGDFVRYKHWQGSYESKDDFNVYPALVSFSNGCFWPIPGYVECEDSWYDYKYYDFEVIGNVFENPEKLKEHV